MVQYRFKVGHSLILVVSATTVSAAWFKLGQQYNDILTDYGYVEFIGVKHDGRN